MPICRASSRVAKAALAIKGCSEPNNPCRERSKRCPEQAGDGISQPLELEPICPCDEPRSGKVPVTALAPSGSIGARPEIPRGDCAPAVWSPLATESPTVLRSSRLRRNVAGSKKPRTSMPLKPRGAGATRRSHFAGEVHRPRRVLFAVESHRIPAGWPDHQQLRGEVRGGTGGLLGSTYRYSSANDHRISPQQISAAHQPLAHHETVLCTSCYCT